jgi:cyanophycinase
MLSVKHLTLRFGLSLSCALALLGWTHAAAAQRRLVLAGGGFQDLTPIVYNGNRPRPPGSGPAPVGAQRNTVEIFQKIIALAGGAKNIGVLTTASDATSARDNGTYYVDVLRYLGAGAGTVWIPVRIANNGSCAVSNSDPALVAQINAMDGFFFGGGDQSRILTCFFNGSGSSRADSPIMAALRARYQAGAVVAGTSAGTSVQSGSPMVTGGESYYGLRYGVYTSLGTSTTVPTRDNNDPNVTTTNYFDRLAYDAVGGLGFFTEGLIDSHFSERGRQGRMIRLAWSRFINFGYGVDENTALVVNNAGTSSAIMSVVGQNGVFIFDLSQASSSVAGPGSTQACSSARGFKLCYVRAHYATPGDTYAPATRTFATAKPAIVGSGSLATRPFPEDIFSSPDNTGSSGRVNPRQFANYAGSLFRSSATRTDQLSFEGLGETRFRVCLEKSSSAGSAGYASTASSAVTGFRDLLIDLVPSTSACP